MKPDYYRLAKEYALEEYEPHQEEYWKLVGAFIKGCDVGKKGLKVVEEGKLINRIVFFFSNETKRFELEHPIWVVDRHAFVRELKRLTGLKDIGVYD